MRAETSNTRLTIDMPTRMHRLVKTHASLSDLTIKDFIIESIKMRFDNEKPVKKNIVKKDEFSKNQMNAKTIAVIEDSIKNHDKLKSFKNVEDMMSYLLAPDEKKRKRKKAKK